MWRIQAMAANSRRRNGNDSDDIAKAIHKMVPRVVIVPIRAPIVEEFLRHKPTKFTGKASPNEVDAWLRKCEKHFNLMSRSSCLPPSL